MTRIAAGMAIFALFTVGCCCLFDKDKLSRRKQKLDEPTFSQYHLEGWSWERVDRVVVLPFLNESGQPRAAEQMQAAFTSELQRMGRFEVISVPHDDRATLATQIHRGGRFDEAVMLDIADCWNADVIIHGIITDYSPYHPRARMGLIIQAISPRQAKVAASVDGLWDTTDMALADRCRTYYRQRARPRPPWIRNHVIVNEDGFAEEIALESPALFKRWVSHEAVLALLGLPVPGVLPPGMNFNSPAISGAVGGVEPACAPPVLRAIGGSVK